MPSLLPGITPDGRRLIAAKALRSLGDGFAAVALAAYLHERGFGPGAVGVLATAALAGTALATLLLGFVVERIGRRRLLKLGTGVVMASGVAFAFVEPYWALLVVAFVGTLNPTSGDVSVFLPVEQAALAGTVAPERRTWLYARYQLGGRLAAATGAFLTGAAGPMSRSFGWALKDGLRVLFGLYAVIGVAMLLVYRGLSNGVETAPPADGAKGGLKESRSIVMRLSALFAVDSFGGGLVIDSIIATWLFNRYGLSVEQAGSILAGVSLLSALSMLLAAPLANRIGLIPTMAYTHIPANIALMAVPLMPSLLPALVLLAIRSTLSQMDVAPRTAFVVSVVAPEERAAAASATNVARSVASAASPALGGVLLAVGPFGLPLLVGGAMKAIYDVALLQMFRKTPIRRDD